MLHIIARHKVADFTKFERVFQGSIDMRKSAGEKSARIFRIVDDPNNVVLFMEWDNLENAKKQMQSEALQKGMEEAGVIEQPDIYFLNEV